MGEIEGLHSFVLAFQKYILNDVADDAKLNKWDCLRDVSNGRQNEGWQNDGRQNDSWQNQKQTDKSNEKLITEEDRLYFGSLCETAKKLLKTNTKQRLRVQ